MARGEYALRACDYCGMQLYANELIGITDRTRTGERRGSRSYFSSRGTIGRGSSRSDCYRLDHLRICPPCYDARARAIRRQTMFNIFGGLIIVGGIGLGVAYIADQPSSPTTNIAQSDAANAQADNLAATTGAPDNAEVASKAPIGPATASGSVADQSTPGALQTDNPPEQSSDRDGRQAYAPTRLGGDQAEIADAIKAATPDALDAQRPEMWHAAGSKGYVVPSSPQVYGSDTCMNVYATKFYGDHQSQSAAVRWCKSADGGDWHLAQSDLASAAPPADQTH